LWSDERFGVLSVAIVGILDLVVDCSARLAVNFAAASAVTFPANEEAGDFITEPAAHVFDGN
jgi:hypothetical protein